MQIPERYAASETWASDAEDRDRIRVLLASDDPFSREAFRYAASAPTIEVVGTTTVRAAAEQIAAEDLRPDVIVLDAQMPAVDALEALRRIHEALPDARVLVFSAPESEEFGLVCLSIGAWGYLSKEIDLASLPRILGCLGAGEGVFSRRLATRVMERLREREHRAGSAVHRAISGPERQLLELLKTGHDIDEAAGHLGVSTTTVRRHLASARRKLTSSPPVQGAGAA